MVMVMMMMMVMMVTVVIKMIVTMPINYVAGHTPGQFYSQAFSLGAFSSKPFKIDLILIKAGQLKIKIDLNLIIVRELKSQSTAIKAILSTCGLYIYNTTRIFKIKREVVKVLTMVCIFS